ncbi:MAG: hypothetical protein IJN90_04055 [Bacilli bacterium]|nr:hypothetical protein [Bacilli bacterium]
MKEELLELRNLTNDYSLAKKNFEERKEVFNEDTKTTMVILASTVVPATYETACEFYDEYETLNSYAEQLKKEHPRYGEKRVSETLLAMFKETKEYQDRTLCASQIIDAYLAFEKAGFKEVRALEENANKIGVELAGKVSDVKTEKVDATIKGVNDAIETIKPYGEIAKKQLTAFGGIAKNAIASGAKRLIKILEEDNTPKDE